MIPNRYHFVWFGREFPLTHALAIRSVAATCAPEAIVLHVSDDLAGQGHFDALVADLPAFAVRPLDVGALLDEGNMPAPARLRQVWDQLVRERRWAALSDILRYLVLYREGGVYLDLDTITVRDLRPLLGAPGFCGRERILVDAAVHRGGTPWRYFRTVPLDLARWICSRTEHGIRRFARIAHLYPAAINGAVLALPSLHPVAHEALRRVPDLVPLLERRRPVIGPDLLQDLIDGERRDDVTVFDPPHFFPLGPQMAAQLFRVRRSAAHVDRALAQAIGADTYVVHWYNDNLKAMPRPPDQDAIRALAERQMFARLALPFLQQQALSGTKAAS
jgi:hypothetical protein